jgi:iron complex outermembrane receptor protein
MKRVTLFLGVMFYLTSALYAQTTINGSLRGRVMDNTGAAIVGAIVTASANGSPLMRTTVTDESGAFDFAQLPAGNYAIKAEKNGFGTVRRDGVELLKGKDATIEFTLEVGALPDSIVITATRLESELKDAPASVSALNAQEIENRAVRYIGDELTGLASVFVQKNDEGAYTGVTIRGVPNRHHNDTFLALLDGIPFVSPGDEVDLEVIPIRIVDRVELVRGPASAMYGRGGVAGAVNYITRSVPNKQTGEFGLDYGSYNWARPHFTWTTPLKQDKNNLLVSGYLEHKDGWRNLTSRNAGNLLIKDQWFLTPRTVLTSLLNYHQFRQGVSSHLPYDEQGRLIEITGGRAANYNIAGSHYRKRIGMGSFRLDHQFAPQVNLGVITHYRQDDNSFRGGFNNGYDEKLKVIDWNGFYGRGQSRTFYVEPQLHWRVGRVRLISGASYERIRNRETEDWTGELGDFVTSFGFYTQYISTVTGRPTNRGKWITDRLLDGRARVNVASAYTQAQIDLTSKLFATVGARFDYFKRAVNFAATSSGGFPTPASQNADQDRHLSPKASLSYRWSPNVTSYVSFGEGFSPAFGPVWSFGSRNTNLKPEIARNYEIGLKADAFNRRLNLSLATFQLDRRDLILLVSDGVKTRTVNVGRHRVRGFELESKFSLEEVSPRLTGWANYSYTNSVWKNNRFVAEFSDDVFDYTGKRVAGVPEHLFAFGLDKGLARGISTRTWLTFVGNYFANSPNTIRAGQHTLLNASVTLPFRDNKYELQIQGTNLTNRKFNYFLGFGDLREAYPGLPFQLSASFKYRF